MLINSPSLRRAALACTLSVFACSASFAQVVAGPAKPTVYNNPQQPNDPRVGLKGGITDAGVAALGMELVVNLPKPTGFAAGTTPQDAAPPPTPPPPVPGAPARLRALDRTAPPTPTWPSAATTSSWATITA